MAQPCVDVIRQDSGSFAGLRTAAAARQSSRQCRRRAGASFSDTLSCYVQRARDARRGDDAPIAVRDRCFASWHARTHLL